ncbi:hypothetical protein CFter6_1176 [Collimonas fungivorans]|uniref:Uncharacterized protein n=1 Tax=Collimonas fungivorans TaxID=158899 RepID=A0A127P7T7_9BURK|nr:hypothetical protein CFter6_1176 [Collimonas fungivorans]
MFPPEGLYKVSESNFRCPRSGTCKRYNRTKSSYRLFPAF